MEYVYLPRPSGRGTNDSAQRKSHSLQRGGIHCAAPQHVLTDMVKPVTERSLDRPAYFLSCHTYGTWLPEDERGWVEGPSRYLNTEAAVCGAVNYVLNGQ